MDAEPCFICRKHAGEVAPPPGGYVYEDEHWRVCHAPISAGVAAGTFFIEARRHFLDFADMLPEEAASYGPLMKRLYAALKGMTDAPRVYALILLEGVPHFHVWLVPRPPDAEIRGMAYLNTEHGCTEDEALAAAERLRAALG